MEKVIPIDVLEDRLRHPITEIWVKKGNEWLKSQNLV